MTPLILVTGFLGAGKTTFVRHLLLDARRENLNVGVIINEFGAVDVDGALLRDAARDLASIAGGCACCAGQDDFVEAVETMSDGRFDCLVVEASGLADPIVLLETLAAPQLLKRVQTTRLICVADASNWNQSAGALGPLMRRQLALADTVVLSKTDLVGASALEALKLKIGALNADARIETAREGRAQSGADAHFQSGYEAKIGSGRKPGSVQGEPAPHAQSHTLWIALPHPVEGAGLQAALDDLGENVWRAKGFVRLRGHSELQLVQLSGGPDGHRVRIAPFAAPWGADEPALGLVFIGAQLDESQLKREFGALGLAF